MDENTVRGWLNDLQNRFDTLFETLVLQRVAVFQRDVFEALFGDENNQAVNTIAGDQEDSDVKDKQENQDEPDIAIPDQVLEEIILHTSDKVKAVPTSMVATYEEHECQESVSGSAALKAKLNSLRLQVINDDLGVITSHGGSSYHMQTSEKELVVLKSPLDQELMFRRQVGMLRRQEQQQLAKDAKTQRRLWYPGIKNAFSDITLRSRKVNYVVSLSRKVIYVISLFRKVINTVFD
ncbi:hypothetical protein Tco_0333356 [Tanacetum coccineum]